MCRFCVGCYGAVSLITTDTFTVVVDTVAELLTSRCHLPTSYHMGCHHAPSTPVPSPRFHLALLCTLPPETLQGAHTTGSRTHSLQLKGHAAWARGYVTYVAPLIAANTQKLNTSMTAVCGSDAPACALMRICCQPLVCSKQHDVIQDLTMDLPGQLLVIKDKGQDTSVVQAVGVYTRLFVQLSSSKPHSAPSARYCRMN